ncbi:MAG TPA: hypothetical protein V6C65_31960 [Allocoleopsis sp.]
MVDPIDDIVRQARQGSVSAIIQVLNDKLADSGVRTRAVFEQGILQLLCEAPTPEQLEQPVLVPHVQNILESLQPRRIRRVNINSRIVREQQLLWLDEINRDPENQLLWSKEVVLKQPNALQRFLQDFGEKKPIDPKASLPKSSPIRVAREKRSFWRGLVGGASLSVFLLLVGWALYSWLEKHPLTSTQETNTQETNTSSNATASPPNNPQGNVPSPANASPLSAAASQDPFTQAVNLAEATVAAGQSAETSAQWLTLAAQWQQASDLMGQVPAEDDRYATAQSRVELYRQNSEAALQQARQAQ